MSKATAKLAGPDRKDQYRVISTTSTLRVRPGELYTEGYVKSHLLNRGNLTVSFVQPKFEGLEVSGRTFVGEPVN